MTDLANDRRSQQRFRADTVTFENGTTVGNVEVAYWTLGQLAADGRNVLLLCHGASGDRDWALPYCRPGGAFDPSRWFIISIDLPGGGASSRLRDNPTFPTRYTIADLAGIVGQMLASLSIAHVCAFCGPSMAGLLGLELALRRPGLIGALAFWTAGHRSDGYAAAVCDAIALGLSLKDEAPNRFRAAAAAFLPALLARSSVARMTADERSALLDDMATRWTAIWDTAELAARYLAVGQGNPVREVDPATLAERLACPIVWLQAASDQLFDLSEVEAFASSLPQAEVRSIATPLGHMATAAPVGSPEFEFFDRGTAEFLACIAR